MQMSAMINEENMHAFNGLNNANGDAVVDPDDSTSSDSSDSEYPEESVVKSKETVGNSWTVSKVILGHKYHHNHYMRSISTDYSQNPQQKVIFFIYFCL